MVLAITVTLFFWDTIIKEKRLEVNIQVVSLERVMKLIIFTANHVNRLIKENLYVMLATLAHEPQ